jgi:methanogenic corrinoid protein MtbC1/DNA-binding transcriptional ArsR family regulator
MKTQDPDYLTQALAEPSRRAILTCLRFGQKSVNEIVALTQLKQPNVSNHLARMRGQGVVRAERVGRQVYYSMASPFAEALLRLHEFTADSLASATPVQEKARSMNGAAVLLPPVDLTAHLDNPETEYPLADDPQLAEWQRAYCQSLLDGQESRALALVNGMLENHLEMPTIYTQVFAWALGHIGELYAQGVIDEAHEHIATGITERMMAKVSHYYAPMRRVGYRALLGCVAGNWHALGLRMLADGLREKGWETLFLGANVPSASFLRKAATVRPDLIVISCAQTDQLETTRQLVAELDALRQSSPNHTFKIAVGGYCFHLAAETLRGLPVDLTDGDMQSFLNRVARDFPLPARTG